MDMNKFSFFDRVGTIHIGGDPQFIVNNGPNNTKTTVNNQRTNITNDRSQHTTNYGGYNNYGQHATGNGQIVNHAPVTMNHGVPRPLAGNSGVYNPGMNDWTPSPSDDDDNFNGNYQPSPRGQNPSYRQPDRSAPRDRDYYGRDRATAQSDPRFGNKKPKETGLPRTKERPKRPKGPFEQTPEFWKEYETMSPKMKERLQSWGFEPDSQKSLNEGMANVTLDDPDLLMSYSPKGFGRQTPDAAQKGKYRADSEEEEEIYTDDADSDGDDLDSRTRVYNDNRVFSTNINSNNVNNETVVDSYNDNSTRTDIKRGSAR